MSGAGAKGNDDKALSQLGEGMRRVARGQFDVKLEEWPDAPFAGIFRDFNQMTECLLATEALRETFVSNVAHEFKTPLAYLQGYATLLQDDELTPELRRTYLQNIMNATNRLSSTISNLLEISNLSRPTATLDTCVYSLDEQLRHMMAIFMPQIERKSLDYDIDLESVDIEASEGLLEDVWTNLLSNALKFTDEGRVGVSLEKRSRQAIVKVADTGCGMTKPQAEHAFDRFYQGDESRSGDGNGLGLAIVKSVVKKHGGTVSVRSELGRGSEFTVILPLRQP